VLPGRPDPLDEAAHSILDQIRLAAGTTKNSARQAHELSLKLTAEIETSANSIKALEADVERYRQIGAGFEFSAPPDMRPDIEALRRKFIDTATLLRTALQKTVDLRDALLQKEKEFDRLSRKHFQIVQYVRALIRTVDKSRAG
jgi:hypothetical protein